MKILLLFTLFSTLGIFELHAKSITFELPIHSHHEKYFITGNTEELCNWNPKCLELKRVKNNIFKIEIKNSHSKVQFKITKGFWETEAVNKEGIPFQNFQLGKLQTYKIPYWKDEVGNFHNHVRYFEQRDQGQAKTDILFVGSSSARLWKNAPPKINGLSFKSRGAGGAHIEDIEIYFNRLIRAYNPSKIIFYIGENDLATTETPKEVFSQFENLLKKTKTSLPHARLFCGTIKVSPSRLNLDKKIKAFNLLLAQNSTCKFVNLYGSLFDRKGQLLKDVWASDLLHLNQNGYQLWLKAIKATLL